MTVKAKILAVDIFGAIVQLTSGVKALCPLPHMSEFEIAKPGKKFNVSFPISNLLFVQKWFMASKTPPPTPPLPKTNKQNNHPFSLFFWGYSFFYWLGYVL